MVHRIMPVEKQRIRWEFLAVVVNGSLGRSRSKHNRYSAGADRLTHDCRKRLVVPQHPQSIQIDGQNLGVEVAPGSDQKICIASPHCRRKVVWIGEGRDRASRHALASPMDHHPKPGGSAKHTRRQIHEACNHTWQEHRQDNRMAARSSKKGICRICIAWHPLAPALAKPIYNVHVLIRRNRR